MAYETDEQQVEALKAWWDENGTSIIFAVVFALAAVGGWRGWQAWQGSRAQDASQLYAELIDRVERGDASASERFSALRDDYDNTPYAVLGALHEAKRLVTANDLGAAAEVLRYAADNASDADLQAVASIRLARVLLESGQADAALGALPSDAPESFEALVETVRGDILFEQDKLTEAKAAYQRAADSGGVTADPEFLDMQLVDLAGKTGG